MRNKVITFIIFAAMMLAGAVAVARGGTDCPPGSTDPDCQAAGGR